MPPKTDFSCLGFPSRETYTFPAILNVEVYRGRCPCRCQHCPVGITEPRQRAKRFGRRGMHLALYERIVKEIAGYPASTLRIHSVGEPLLWADLAPALKLTRAYGVRSWLFTCAVTRDQSLLRSVCAHTDIVEVSVNSITAQDYARTKGIDAFGLVVENIRYMHGLKDKGHAFRLIASRVQSPDEAADREFVAYWRRTGLVDDAFVRTYHTYNDLLPEMSEAQGGQRHEPCLVHWARLNISVEGYALVCFNELFKERLEPALIYGDVKAQSMAEIWHGQKLSTLRQAELTGDYAGLPFAGVLPCKDCYSCQPLRGSRQTSEHQIGQITPTHKD
jgi:MoaA/NifB/PqqE/SkfB family radical SAM enzyme